MCHHPGYHRQGKEEVSGSLGPGRRELLVRDFCPIMLQVAFASDFDSEWNQMPLLLKHSRATGVGSLLDHTFIGMQKAMDNPLYQVEWKGGVEGVEWKGGVEGVKWKGGVEGVEWKGWSGGVEGEGVEWKGWSGRGGVEGVEWKGWSGRGGVEGVEWKGWSGRGGVEGVEWKGWSGCGHAIRMVKVNIIHQTCMWRCVLLARVRLLALTVYNISTLPSGLWKVA